jgi:putative ABC transport system permease protein
MQALLRDLRYAVRSLRRSPAVVGVIVLSLALGIGANTAIFSLVNAVLLKSLPVSRPEELVVVMSTARRGVFSYAACQHLRTQTAVLSDVMCLSNDETFETIASGTPQELPGAFVSDNYFSGLGVTAERGRFPSATDQDGVVISHGFWQRHFGGDVTTVGHALVLNGVSTTVMAITPAGFFGETVGKSPDVWVPLGLVPRLLPDESSLLTDASTRWLQLIGRRHPDMPLERARAGLQLAYDQWSSEFAPTGKGADQNTQEQLGLESGSKGLSALRTRFAQPLLVLLGVTGLVLLTGCLNIANLLLARAVARQREFALRLSLGAPRTHLLRQMIAEGVLLATVALVVSLFLARWASQLLLAYVSTTATPLPVALPLDPTVLGFASAVSVLSILVFGIGPAFRATRTDLALVLKGNGAAPRVGRRIGSGQLMVVLEVGACMVLLVAAGLFIRTLQQLTAFPTSAQWDHVVVTHFTPPPGRTRDFYQASLDRVRAFPGVRAASMSTLTFGAGATSICCVDIDGYVRAPGESGAINTNRVSPGFFQTMGVSLLRGRDLLADDLNGDVRATVINEAAQHHYFGDQSAIGKHITVGRLSVDVVGVVRDVQTNSLRESVAPMLYTPALQRPRYLEVRSTGAPEQLVSTIRRLLSDDLKIDQIDRLDDLAGRTVVQERVIAKLCGFFGIVATLLACIGLYGVLSHAVHRRTREIAIRMALGSRRGDVITMIMRESAMLVVCGMALGLASALALGRLIANQLFGIEVTDPTSIGLALALLAAVAALASYLPAHNGSRIDLLATLRRDE